MVGTVTFVKYNNYICSVMDVSDVRPIKYRGYNHRNRRWYIGWLISLKGLVAYISSIDDSMLYEVDSRSVGLFSCETDRNGVPIYEDDRLRVVFPQDFTHPTLLTNDAEAFAVKAGGVLEGYVEWFDGMLAVVFDNGCHLSFYDIYDYDLTIEVIGNKFNDVVLNDTPEFDGIDEDVLLSRDFDDMGNGRWLLSLPSHALELQRNSSEYIPTYYQYDQYSGAHINPVKFNPVSTVEQLDNLIKIAK